MPPAGGSGYRWRRQLHPQLVFAKGDVPGTYRCLCQAQGGPGPVQRRQGGGESGDRVGPLLPLLQQARWVQAVEGDAQALFAAVLRLSCKR